MEIPHKGLTRAARRAAPLREEAAKAAAVDPRMGVVKSQRKLSPQRRGAARARGG